MKYCIDCVHLRGNTCRNPKTADESPIDGTLKFYRAETLRGISVCGKEARLFEPVIPSEIPSQPF